nr:hypothetical protein CFP56_72252 [Quercus suber]
MRLVSKGQTFTYSFAAKQSQDQDLSLKQPDYPLSLSQMAANYGINPSLISAMDLLHVIFPALMKRFKP